LQIDPKEVRMDLELSDKVALVTGAGIGIGRAIAHTLSDEGCRIAVVGRREALMQEIADELEQKRRPRPLIIVQDITDADAAERVKATVDAAFPSLDILVNNAGGSRPLEEWDEAMRLNFHAGRELAHAFLPAMRSRKFGRIINITGSDEPIAVNAAVPPNGAVHIWAKALARVVGADGVTVNSIPPGRIHSEQIDKRLLPSEAAQRAWVEENCPAGYIGEPEDLAVLVAFLASPRARYITGQVIHVDGGARRVSH
jgi:3-oxoacyl-[acyl-carrier protein] reductase